MNIYYGFYVSPSYKLVETAPTACTPGRATFQLMARDISKGTSSNVGLWLTPLANRPATFPERAWLREINVMNWGSADNLHVARFGDRLSFKGAQVSNGHVLAPSAKSAMRFDVGDVPMSTMLGSANFTLETGTTLPEVEISWTCEANPNDPHYSVIQEPGYLARIPPQLGIGRAIAIWVDWPGGKLRVAPQGRFEDYLLVDLKPSRANASKFSGRLPAYDASFEGQGQERSDRVLAERQNNSIWEHGSRAGPAADTMREDSNVGQKVYQALSNGC